jgi:uncharacterized protein (TIGR02284 family)
MAFPQKVEKLHTTLIDARNGYEESAKDSEDPTVAAFFLGMIDLHARHADEIGGALRELGLKSDDSGSFLSTVHRAAVRLRSAVVGLDAQQLQPFIDGEQRIVAEYDDALEESRERGDFESLLDRQRNALLAKVADARRMMSEATSR